MKINKSKNKPIMEKSNVLSNSNLKYYQENERRIKLNILQKAILNKKIKINGSS